MNTPTAIKTGDIELIIDRVKTREIHKGCKYNGLSALHLAAMYDQIEIAEILIKAGADINLPTEVESMSTFGVTGQSTPMHIAAQFNSLRVFSLLMKSEAELTNYDDKKETPLIIAIKNQSLEISNFLLQKEAYDLESEEEMKCLLSWTIKNGNYNVAKVLIYPGANINYVLEEGKSLLILAAEKENASFVELLLNAGADVNFSYNSEGYRKTALYEAINHNSSEIVEKLIDADANVNLCVRPKTSRQSGYNIIIEDKVTLLSFAINGGSPIISKMLIEAGADFNNNFYDDGVLFNKAVQGGNTAIFKVMLECGVAKHLLDSALESHPQIVQLVEEVVNSRINDNKNILAKFMIYLTGDTSGPLFSFPKDILLEIAEYATDSEIILSLQGCNNYIKYHPFNGEVAPPPCDGDNLVQMHVLGEDAEA